LKLSDTLQNIFKRDAIGRGDYKLVAMLALFLGPIGTLFELGISYVIAEIFCLVGLDCPSI
tara:strand:- start:967 stop:1149 length:183 start_codon:yes stop_codon:yes gene_type:complete